MSIIQRRKADGTTNRWLMRWLSGERQKGPRFDPQDLCSRKREFTLEIWSGHGMGHMWTSPHINAHTSKYIKCSMFVNNYKNV